MAPKMSAHGADDTRVPCTPLPRILKSRDGWSSSKAAASFRAVARLWDWFVVLPDNPVITLGDIQRHNMAVVLA